MSADLHHLAAAYALDALDDIERREFENHYPTCEICTIEVNEFREVASALAASTATAPPAGLKASLMAEIAETRQLSPLATSQSAKAPRFSSRVLVAAAAALIVLAGVVAVTLPGSTDDQANEIVSASDAIETPLAPGAEGPPGDLKVTWSNELDQVLIEGSLPDLDATSAYVLWFLLDEGVAPAGRFVPQDGMVDIVLDVDDLAAGGWGVTIEPATGLLNTPTDPIIFVGTI